MSKYRPPSENSKYYIPKEDYLTAIHYSLRYPLWLEQVKDQANTSRAINYDSEKVQTSGISDITANAAIKISETNEKIQMIEGLIEYVGKDLSRFLKLGVCYGLTFEQLKGKGMPCERDKYYLMRRHYYFELIKRI